MQGGVAKAWGCWISHQGGSPHLQPAGGWDVDFPAAIVQERCWAWLVAGPSQRGLPGMPSLGKASFSHSQPQNDTANPRKQTVRSPLDTHYSLGKADCPAQPSIQEKCFFSQDMGYFFFPTLP